MRVLGITGSIGGSRRRFERDRRAAVVPEVYSPPIAMIKLLPSFQCAPGVAMDLTTGWDASIRSQRERATAILIKHAPMLLIGSPPCTAFASLQDERFAPDA